MLQTRGFSFPLCLLDSQSVVGFLNDTILLLTCKTYFLFFLNADEVQAQIVELQKVLESFSSVENEINALRSQKTALERDVELASATRQGSGGFLSWLSGGPCSQ